VESVSGGLHMQIKYHYFQDYPELFTNNINITTLRNTPANYNPQQSVIPYVHTPYTYSPPLPATFYLPLPIFPFLFRPDLLTKTHPLPMTQAGTIPLGHRGVGMIHRNRTSDKNCGSEISQLTQLQQTPGRD